MFPYLVDFFPHTAHSTAHLLLSLYSQIQSYKKPSPLKWRSFRWKGLDFPNPLSPAGGMDKNAKHLQAWWALGAGFIEIGTVTPLPQKTNPGATLKRSYQQKAIWNHLGFPNEGSQAIQKTLKKWENFRPTPIFANIGKNRQTLNKNAPQDYLQCIDDLAPYVDAFVINISSPNTLGLKKLAEPKALKILLRKIQQKLNQREKKIPFLIKWSPDMNELSFRQAVDIALECGAEGHIICNSSLQRPTHSHWPTHGGLSGAGLAPISKQKLELIQKHLGSERQNQLLISVGGILTVEDIFDRLTKGAHLVQVYSALVLKSPFFFKTSRKASPLPIRDLVWSG